MSKISLPLHPIESASVQEAPFDGFIRPAELVLSTAAGCREDPAVLFDLVREAGSAHAAALFLAFKDPFTIPQAVIDTAWSMALPIFEIPWGIRFSEIVATVTREAEASRTAVFRELQSDLLNAYYEGRPLEDAARIIARSLHTEVFFCDAAGNPVARSGAASSHPETDYLTFPVEAGSRKFATIYLLKKTRKPLLLLAEEPEIAPRFLGFPLSLWFNRQSIEEQTRLRIRSDFVRDLSDDAAMDPEERGRQAAHLGIRLNVPYLCIVLRLQPAPDPEIRLNEEIEQIIRELSDQQDLTVLSSSRISDTVLYLACRTEETEAKVDSFLDAFEERLREAAPDLSCRWGISAVSGETPDFPLLYRDASAAAGFAAASTDGRFRFRYPDTQEAKIVSWLSENRGLRENAERTVIQPLRDAARGSDVLIETLVQYISCGGNAAMAARALPVHRQTLLYRLRRIEQATGLSLSSHRDLFLLEIATRMFFTYPQ